jgi:hypothetical protein
LGAPPYQGAGHLERASVALERSRLAGGRRDPAKEQGAFSIEVDKRYGCRLSYQRAIKQKFID